MMKRFAAVALIAAFVAAEVPSHSYLPPPPRGYSSQASTPAVVAARAPDQGQGDHHNGDHHGTASSSIGLVRSGIQNHEHGVLVHDAHSQDAHSVDAHSVDAHSLDAQARFNSNDEGYDQNAAGVVRNALDEVNATVSYEADERGFKPQISYEDSEESRSTGYNANANNFPANNGYHGNEQDGGHAESRSSGY